MCQPCVGSRILYLHAEDSPGVACKMRTLWNPSYILVLQAMWQMNSYHVFGVRDYIFRDVDNLLFILFVQAMSRWQLLVHIIKRRILKLQIWRKRIDNDIIIQRISRWVQKNWEKSLRVWSTVLGRFLSSKNTIYSWVLWIQQGDKYITESRLSEINSFGDEWWPALLVLTDELWPNILNST